MNLCDYQEISALKPSKVKDSEILDFLIDNAIGKENAVPEIGRASCRERV